MIETLKNKNLLHLHNVRKTYPDKTKSSGKVIILDDIDLSVSKGEFCTVVGPSGCGKSTLLRLILGQEIECEGDIFLNNKKIGHADKQRGIVYQNYSLFENKTVLENVMSFYKFNTPFYKRFNKDLFNKAKEEALFYIEKVRLSHAIHKYPAELSGGMKQRAAIAQSLISKPKILLMDEPFSALDPGTREELQLFTREIAEENNMTIFFVSHDLEEAVFLGTRLLVLSQFWADGKNNGARIVADIDTSEFNSQESKSTTKFRHLIEDIRKIGFDPTYLQHIKEFNLSHKDSFND